MYLFSHNHLNLTAIICCIFIVAVVSDGKYVSQSAKCTFEANSVCEGEDWLMPNGSVWSSEGSVVTGWGYSTKFVSGSYWPDAFSNATRGRGFLKWWKSLADDLGAPPIPATNYSGYDGLLKALFIHDVQDCYESCDVPSSCKDFDYDTDYSRFLDGTKYDYKCNKNFTSEHPIYMGLFTSSNGAASPKWLKTEIGARYLLESLYDWCMNQSWCEMTLDKSTDEYIAEYTGSSYTTQMNVIVSLCNDYDVFNGVYDPLDPLWQEQRLYFLQGIAGALNKLDIANAFETIDMNAESGELGYYCQIGFWNYSKFDQFWEGLVNQTLSNVDLPASKFMCNMGGGRLFKRLKELAQEHGMGVGVHGATGLFSWFSAQRMPFLSYSQNLKGYINNGKHNPYSKIHSDLEVFHLANNTYGQYRIFRMTSMADLAMGADSLLVSGNTFASYGLAQEKGCAKEKYCYFNYETATDIGGVDFFNWMNYQIGTSIQTAPEAFTLMIDSGSEIPEGVNWQQEYQDALATDDWDEDPDKCRFNQVYLVSPPVTHFGRHMYFLSSLPEGVGVSLFPMNETNMKGETSTLSNWVFGYRLPYEARAPTHLGGLYYVVLDEFLRRSAEQYAIKVHFKIYNEGNSGPQENGEFAIFYSSPSCKWEKIPNSVVQLNATSYSYEKFYTASFLLDHQFSDHKGPGGSNLAIVHTKGRFRPAIFAVRVIRVRNVTFSSGDSTIVSCSAVCFFFIILGFWLTLYFRL